ncbi:MAG: hypothetical protein HPY90_10160 [Syntrophothermus sp.]|uniref:hypothetical protein n=1 Tax=Syntrophothermus sp. TaxID=2736299 RepID=UPI002580BDA4|nr:hypothetical protein [Syntrophothermus sp.]NSW83615.1 hypothetical protein [Syntrophothermus sp.]
MDVSKVERRTRKDLVIFSEKAKNKQRNNNEIFQKYHEFWHIIHSTMIVTALILSIIAKNYWHLNFQKTVAVFSMAWGLPFLICSLLFEPVVVIVMALLIFYGGVMLWF